MLITKPSPNVKNCLTCKNYLRCSDKAKSIIYICKRYDHTAESEISGMLRVADFAELNANRSDIDLSPSPILLPTAKDNSRSVAAIVRKQIEKTSTLEIPDVRLNFDDIPTAKNFFDWCTGPQFLKQRPYIWQAMIGVLLFAEYCPNCSDKDYIAGGWKPTDSYKRFKSKVALLEHGVCPHCKAKQSDLIRKHGLRHYQEGVVVAGQRSGKSHETAFASSYLIHRLLCIKKPNELYGLPSSNILHGTFVALTYAQAKDTLWEPLYGLLLEAPWFENFHAMLDASSTKFGEELYNLKDTFVLYKTARIFFYPAGPDKRVLRGRTRIWASIDELGWFPNDIAALKNVKMNATEVYTALERSLLTARAAANKLVTRGFNNVPQGIFFNISSPSSVRDKVMELFRKSLGSKKLLGIQKATWELNPNVTKEDLQEEFTKDPVGAMRDYGAQPPLSNNAFISVKDHITGAYSKKSNQIVLENRHKKYKDGTDTRYAIARQMSKTNRKSVLALDAGVSNNSFAFACGSLVNDMPRIDLVGEVIPSPGVIINYTKMTELLEDIILKRSVAIIAADRWNSIKLLHDFRDEFDIKAVQYSLKYVDMVVFKDCLAQGQIEIPTPKWALKEILEYDHSQYPTCFNGAPVEHLVLQLMTVQDTGTQVIKGDQLTDDIARAVMLCHRILTDEDNAEILSGMVESSETSSVNVREMAVVRTSSGASSGSSMSHVSSSGKAVGILRR